MTPETGGRALAMKRAHGLHYEVLTDVDLGIAMAFGIVFSTPPLYAGLLRRGGMDLAERSGNVDMVSADPGGVSCRTRRRDRAHLGQSRFYPAGRAAGNP